ncbi:Protein of unknown function [Pseudovibrio sp. Tun.PSC04-5.I4]|nr:Protein of unknown function [Pseudovibrio sp. Tun.PSC04-5.I4]
MQMIRFPESNVRILKPVAELDYFDSQAIEIPSIIHPLEAWRVMMKKPQPILKAAFKVRDEISSLFGVKKISGFGGEIPDTVVEGDYLDFFLVEHTDESALVLTERDKHLDVMTCISTDGSSVAVTSSVLVHNWFGHAYMVPVGIAHKWIVRGSLEYLEKELAGIV